MNLEKIFDDVLPEEGILYKQNHGCWQFYKDESSFEKDGPYTRQSPSESFSEFIHRTLNKLMEDEEGDEEPLVRINYAVALSL